MNVAGRKLGCVVCTSRTSQQIDLSACCDPALHKCAVNQSYTTVGLNPYAARLVSARSKRVVLGDVVASHVHLVYQECRQDVCT